ncbi:MAG: dUTP diphosphatase [Phascolarctobacterium sp.]
MNRTSLEPNPEFEKNFKLRYFEPVKDAPTDTILPKRKTKNAAGYDFYSPCDFVVPAKGTSETIYFGVKAHMLHNEFLQLIIRSGLSIHHGVLLACSGVIDADFANNPDNDGNIAAKFFNTSNEDYHVKKGDRVCQGIFMKYYRTHDDDGGEAVRGYGSTGR